MAFANVAELADAQDLGSCPARGPGSTPGVRIYSLDLLTVTLKPSGSSVVKL